MIGPGFAAAAFARQFAGIILGLLLIGGAVFVIGFMLGRML